MDTKKTTPNKKKNKTIITNNKDESQSKVTKICKTTSRLNMREQPGMDKKILTVIPQGA